MQDYTAEHKLSVPFNHRQLAAEDIKLIEEYKGLETIGLILEMLTTLGEHHEAIKNYSNIVSLMLLKKDIYETKVHRTPQEEEILQLLKQAPDMERRELEILENYSQRVFIMTLRERLHYFNKGYTDSYQEALETANVAVKEAYVKYRELLNELEIIKDGSPLYEKVLAKEKALKAKAAAR